MSRSSKESPDQAGLRPTVALVHPLWVGALGLLVLNDHILKGAGLLPGTVTGKLSDVAGLVVAPLLLAALARVRSRAGLARCHVAVGVVFASIQLWQPAADTWASWMAALAFPWQIVPDPLDLLALPALLLSWHVFAPAVARGEARGPALATLRGAMACVGLLACMGTSPPERPEFFADFFGEAYLHNDTDQDRVVRVRELRTDILVDCGEVEADPGRLLQAALFGDARTWSIPPTANVPVGGDGFFEEEPSPHGCRAVLLESDEAAPRVVFWFPGDLGDRLIPGNTFDQKDHDAGAIVIHERKGDISYDDLDAGILFAPTPEPEPDDAACRFPSDGDRLEWSTPLPLGTFELVNVDFGADGCIELELPSQTRWYVCVPGELFPFAPGDTIDIGPLPAVGPAIAGTYDGVRVRRIDPATLTPTADEAELFMSRGTGMPAMWGTGAMHSTPCPVATEPECSTAARGGALSLLAGGGVHSLSTGQILTNATDGDGASLSFALMHVQDRVILDPACALGPDALGLDLEIAGSRILP